MKKSDILEENQQVLFAIDKFEKFTQNANDISSQRLRSCNAIVYENEKYYYLQSYRTIIAFIEKDTNTLVDFCVMFMDIPQHQHNILVNLIKIIAIKV